MPNLSRVVNYRPDADNDAETYADELRLRIRGTKVIEGPGFARPMETVISPNGIPMDSDEHRKGTSGREVDTYVSTEQYDLQETKSSKVDTTGNDRFESMDSNTHNS